MGNADALQQRARFLGYKGRYLGLCRVYLEQATRAAFEEYVEHEEIMRRELEQLAATGESLRSWKRRFVLSADLQPCRRSVISDDYMRVRPGGGWTQQRGAEMTAEIRTANGAAIRKLVDSLRFHNDKTYTTSEIAQQHQVATDTYLARVVDMLVDYRFEDPRDTATFMVILVELGEALRQDPNVRAAVYKMRPKAEGVRTVSEEGTLEDGFQQGRTALVGGGTAYPGDAFFKAKDRLTVQLHAYDLRRDGKAVASSAPLIAVHIPSHLARDWLVQNQAGQRTK